MKGRAIENRRLRVLAFFTIHNYRNGLLLLQIISIDHSLKSGPPSFETEQQPKNHFFISVSFLPLPIRIRKTD